MSYILDALRKADAERERGAVPDLHAQLLPPGSQPQRMLSKTAGIDVKLPSTIRPLASSTCDANSTAIALPSEWPKM